MQQNNLLKQIESYVRESESWKIGHDKLAAHDDLEDWLDLGLGLLAALRRVEQRCKARYQTGERLLDCAKIDFVDELCWQWYGPCNHLLSLIAQFEAECMPIRNGSEFIEACKSSHILGFDSDSLQRAADDYRKHGGTPLKDAMDELRDRIERRSTANAV